MIDDKDECELLQRDLLMLLLILQNIQHLNIGRQFIHIHSHPFL